MSSRRIFKRIQNLPGDLNEDQVLEELDEISDFILQHVKTITDEEAWALLHMANRVPSSTIDGYMGLFSHLIEETAPSWPFYDELLLHPAYEQTFVDFKVESLYLSNNRIAKSEGLPVHKYEINAEVDNYWDEIEWSKITFEEFRFLLLALFLSSGDNPESKMFTIPKEIFEKFYESLKSGTIFLEEKEGLKLLDPV